MFFLHEKQYRGNHGLKGLCFAVSAFIVSFTPFMHTPQAQAAGEKPLVSFKSVASHYQGGFKIYHRDETSTTSFSPARMAYNKKNNSVFFSSHSYQDAIAEFSVPPSLSTSDDIKTYTRAAVKQNFQIMHAKSKTGMTQEVDGIGGMCLIDGKLYMQYYLGYDATGGRITNTTLIIDTPDDLANSNVQGFFEMEGTARVVNYISEIPAEWQEKLGATHLAGNGDGMSIVSRLSNGPSLYTFNPSDFPEGSGFVPTTEVLNYPLAHALSTSLFSAPDEQVEGYQKAWDAFNLTGKNDLWTESSAVWYGFIIPGTRTFAAIGQQGMHRSGGGYKITQDNGRLCGGPCPNKYDDWDTYYWLYDLDDILIKAQPYDALPYEYGIFDNRFLTPFTGGANGLPSSATFDQESKVLYVAFRNGAGADKYADHIIATYDLSTLPFVKAPPSKTISDVK
jgi:hypothetical protein